MPDYTNCKNMFGPLKDDIKACLDAFFQNPDEKHWDDVHCIIIGADGFTTFWQAVCAVDPNFPRTGPRYYEDGTTSPWPRVPDLFTARRALEYAQGLRRKVYQT